MSHAAHLNRDRQANKNAPNSAAQADSDGNVYVAGHTNSALDGNVNAGLDDIFVMKFDASGTHQWTSQRGSSAGDAALATEARSLQSVRCIGAVAGACVSFH